MPTPQACAQLTVVNQKLISDIRALQTTYQQLTATITALEIRYFYHQSVDEAKHGVMLESIKPQQDYVQLAELLKTQKASLVKFKALLTKENALLTHTLEMGARLESSPLTHSPTLGASPTARELVTRYTPSPTGEPKKRKADNAFSFVGLDLGPCLAATNSIAAVIQPKPKRAILRAMVEVLQEKSGVHNA